MALKDEQGIFRLDDVPSKPHPHCYCYLTAADLPTLEELEEALADGAFDTPDNKFSEDPKFNKKLEQVSRSRTYDEFLNDPELTYGDESYGDTGFEGLRKRLSNEENRAIDEYTRADTFFKYRDDYRAGRSHLMDYVDENYDLVEGVDTSAVLDRLFSKTSISEDTTLYRAMSVGKDWLASKGVGSSIDHTFFISTSTESSLISAFGAEKQKANVVLKIWTPKGTPAITGATGLNEVILKSDTKMVVRRVAELSGRTLLEVEIVK